jgi:hypothetical protein
MQDKNLPPILKIDSEQESSVSSKLFYIFI